MPHVPAARATMTVALIGNPNTGKSSLFGALVGVRQRVGNYPGVTVERRSGLMEYAGRKIEVVDLPGLAQPGAAQPDEMVAVDVARRQDGVLAGRAGRVRARRGQPGPESLPCQPGSQLGLPTVVAINMMDSGREPRHPDRLRPVGGAARRSGRGDAGGPPRGDRGAEGRDASRGRPERARLFRSPPRVPLRIDRLAGWFLKSGNGSPGRAVARPLLERLVLDASGYLERSIFAAEGSPLAEELAALRLRLEQSGCAVPGVETRSRYAWIEQIVSGAVHEPDNYLPTWTDRLDAC